MTTERTLALVACIIAVATLAIVLWDLWRERKRRSRGTIDVRIGVEPEDLEQIRAAVRQAIDEHVARKAGRARHRSLEG